MLEAQTGTGKTFFIQNKLIPYLDNTQKLLLICNRTNLKRQFKIDILTQYGYEELIPYDKNGNLNFEELDKITTINGNITITSYHAINESYLNEQYIGGECDLSSYDYIVCDEVHYILADGSFNNKCRISYKKLLIEYKHLIRLKFSLVLLWRMFLQL